MLAAVVVVLPSVLVISKRVRGAIVERVSLRLRILLRVEVLVGEGSVVARAGIVRV